MTDEQLELKLGGARVLFTTRRDGSLLNERNRVALERRLGVRLAYGRQVHGAEVRRVRDAVMLERVVEADGQATTLRGIAPMVRAADCLPVAVAGSGGVAMLHAGWRGLASGVLTEGVSALRELGVEGDLRAVIGPGAGPCCYEVGAEVHAIFGSGTGNLDMKAIARAQLLEAGVQEVQDVGLCTICGDPQLFYSYRREGEAAGRHGGVAWLS